MTVITTNTHRLNFSYYLFADQDFLFCEQATSGVAIEIVYRVFNLEGRELFFTEEEVKKQYFNFNKEQLYIRNIIHCRYLSDGKIEFFRDINSLETLKDYVITYEIKNYFRVVEGGKRGQKYFNRIVVSQDEFKTILKEHSFNFRSQENEKLLTQCLF